MKKSNTSMFNELVTLLRFDLAAWNHRDGIAGRAWREGRRAKAQNSLWVRAAPQAAFDYVADITRHNDWATDEIRVTPLTPGPVRLGSEFAAVGIQGGREWPSRLVVTGYEPPRRFEFTATGGPIPAPAQDPHRHEFLFTPENGGTRIDVCKTDPAPEDWSPLKVRLIAPLARLTMGNRYQAMQNLRACINRL